MLRYCAKAADDKSSTGMPKNKRQAFNALDSPDFMLRRWRKSQTYSEMRLEHTFSTSLLRVIHSHTRGSCRIASFVPCHPRFSAPQFSASR